MSAPVRVALIGANGHGRWHRRQLATRHDSGQIDLVALSDVNPIATDDDSPVPRHARVFDSHLDMLAQTRPDVVVICTPPHTHLDIASAALHAGCDVLLEKPPVLSLAEHRTLVGVLAETGRACQVGFQALGSAALTALIGTVRRGLLGAVTGVSAVASWQRPDSYYTRSPWAGRRVVDGRAAVDGALANPLAHAVMQCLAVGEAATGSAQTSTVELERYRTRRIEVEDTACLRARLDTGLPVVVAVTLCGEDFIPGEVIVHSAAGRAVLEYPTDRLRLPGEDRLREIPGRTSLLDNLLAHRAAPAKVPLLVPLARTEPFTAVLDHITAAPLPVLLSEEWVSAAGELSERHRTITGVNAVLRRAADELALFSELHVPWSHSPR